MLQGKVWGSTESLLVTPMIELHRINVNPMMRCSEHKHQYKWNAFYCVSGYVEIHVRKNDYALTDVTELRAGEFTTVPPNEYHWFESKQVGAQVLEIYYVEPISADIVRNSVGGEVYKDEGGGPECDTEKDWTEYLPTEEEVYRDGVESKFPETRPWTDVIEE